MHHVKAASIRSSVTYMNVPAIQQVTEQASQDASLSFFNHYVHGKCGGCKYILAAIQ